MPGKGPVLIIDDEVLVQNLLGMLLEGDGFEVLSALSGARGLELARQAMPQAIILDVGLPDMDGFEVCRRLREMTDAVVLFATAKNNKEDIVRGLQLGGDDYVVKPYSYEELIARLNACLRRQKDRRRPTFVRSAQGEGLLLDPSQRVVFIENGESVQLTPKEFELLRFMVEKRGEVLSADDILSNVWGPAYVGEKDLVKQFIRRLRSKLELDPSDPQSIVTIRGSGYAFEEVTKPGSLKKAEAGEAGGISSRSDLPSSSDPTRPGMRRHDILKARSHPPSATSASSAGEAAGRSAGKRGWRAWARYAVGIGLVLLIVVGVALVSSARALPGEPLYPLRTLSEDLRLAVTADELQSVRLRLEYADRRLDETGTMLRAQNEVNVAPMLAAYEEQVRQASSVISARSGSEEPADRALRVLYEETLIDHEQSLQSLSGFAPLGAQSAFDHALAFLQQEQASLQGQPAASTEPGGSLSGIPPATPDEEATLELRKYASGSAIPTGSASSQPTEHALSTSQAASTAAPAGSSQPVETTPEEAVLRPTRSAEPTSMAQATPTPVEPRPTSAPPEVTATPSGRP